MDPCYTKTTVLLIMVLLIMMLFGSVSKFEPLQPAVAGDLSESYAEKVDTRYINPYLPPVHPIVYRTQRERFSNDLEILKVPLQMNDPFDEQLRSQIISVSKYNKIK